MMRKTSFLAVMAAVAVISGGMALAQEGDRPGRGVGERGARPAQGDQTDMRQRIEDGQRRMAAAMKERLGVSDEEWLIIEPRITAVTTLRARTVLGGLGGIGGLTGGRGAGTGAGPWPGRGTEGADAPASTVRMRELRDLLQSETTSTAAIQTALDGLRAAREKDREELKTAQDSLRELLTLRQEATLVTMGVLE